MRIPILLFAIALTLSTQLVSQLVAAQSPPVTDPREMPEAARKAYSKGLKDAPSGRASRRRGS